MIWHLILKPIYWLLFGNRYEDRWAKGEAQRSTNWAENRRRWDQVDPDWAQKRRRQLEVERNDR